MKAISLLLVLGALTASYFIMSPPTDLYEDHFQRYMALYGKNYQNSDEYALRYSVFKANLMRIEESNKQGKSYTLGMNKYGDWTDQEFKNFLGYKKMPVNSEPEPFLGKRRAAKIDWRDHNAVTPVQDQGSCGSCWAFSATGAIEGSYALFTRNLVKYSEQQLIDCSGDYGNEGCNGGLMENAFEYLRAYAFCEERDYPYTGTDDTCKADDCTHTEFVISKYRTVTPNSAEALQESLNNNVIAVAVEADKDAFRFYESGVVNDHDCGTDLNHGVLAVGYGTEEDGTDYYIVKNSWGADWGEEGYIKIGLKFEDEGGVCGILQDETFPLYRC